MSSRGAILSNSVVRLASIDTEDWPPGVVVVAENLRRHSRLYDRLHLKEDMLRLDRQPSIMLHRVLE